MFVFSVPNGCVGFVFGWNLRQDFRDFTMLQSRLCRGEIFLDGKKSNVGNDCAYMDTYLFIYKYSLNFIVIILW